MMVINMGKMLNKIVTETRSIRVLNFLSFATVCVNTKFRGRQELRIGLLMQLFS